jgi:hypothetical protein
MHRQLMQGDLPGPLAGVEQQEQEVDQAVDPVN